MPDADRTEIIANYERLGMQIRLEEREIRVPLPAEGQRPAAFFAGRPRTGPLPPHEEPIPPRVGPMSAAQARKEALRDRGGESERGKEHGKEGHPPEPKMWEEGTYMWYTQNTWHAIDHLIMMRTNLQTQAAWERYQERMRLEGPPLAAVMDAGRAREYRDSRRETARKASRDVKDEQTTQAAVRDGRSGPGADATADRTPTSEASDSEYESVVNTRPGEWAPRPSGLPSFPNLEYVYLPFSHYISTDFLV